MSSFNTSVPSHQATKLKNQPDIEVKPITKELRRDAIDLVTKGLTSVPLRRALGLHYQGERQFFDTLLNSLLDDKGNVTHVAWDKANNILASVGICLMETKDIPDFYQLAMLKHEHNKNRGLSGKIFDFLCEGFDIYNTDKVLKLHYGSSNSRNKRMGLSEQIVRRAMNVSKERGTGAAYSTLSGNFTYPMYKKMGYDLLRELKYEDIVIDGRRPLLNSKETKGQDHLMLVARAL